MMYGTVQWNECVQLLQWSQKSVASWRAAAACWSGWTRSSRRLFRKERGAAERAFCQCSGSELINGAVAPVLEFLNNLWGARNRVGKGLSYRPARLHRLAELIQAGGIDFIESIPGFLYYKFKNSGSD
jgi:hypothetical protein